MATLSGNADALRVFHEIVESLSVSKDVIQRATRVIIDNPAIGKDCIDTIREKVKVVSPKKRLAFFFLLDSVAQNGSKNQIDDLVELVGSSLQEVTSYVIEHPNVCNSFSGIDNSTKVEKAITVWKARDIFSTDVVRAVLHIVETAKLHPRFRLTPEEDKILRKIEEIRRDQKFLQLENSLRPENDSPWSEMEELFSLIPAPIIIPLAPSPVVEVKLAGPESLPMKFNTITAPSASNSTPELIVSKKDKPDRKYSNTNLTLEQIGSKRKSSSHFTESPRSKRKHSSSGGSSRSSVSSRDRSRERPSKSRSGYKSRETSREREHHHSSSSDRTSEEYPHFSERRHSQHYYSSSTNPSKHRDSRTASDRSSDRDYYLSKKKRSSREYSHSHSHSHSHGSYSHSHGSQWDMPERHKY